MPVVKLLVPALAERVGAKQIEVQAGRVGSVLEALGVEPDRDLRVLVNGRSIAFLDGADTALAPDDVVTIYAVGMRGWPGG